MIGKRILISLHHKTLFIIYFLFHVDGWLHRPYGADTVMDNIWEYSGGSTGGIEEIRILHARQMFVDPDLKDRTYMFMMILFGLSAGATLSETPSLWNVL